MADCYLGEIRMFAGSFAPEGWALCDGSMLSVSAYQALFSLIGAIYGGDGVSTFALPDLRGRIPVGMGNGTGLTPRVIGQNGGGETAALPDGSYLPPHTHALVATTVPASTNTGSSSVLFASTATETVGTTPLTIYQLASDITGEPVQALAGQTVASNLTPNYAHANVMPSTVITYIIATNGIYPTQG